MEIVAGRQYPEVRMRERFVCGVAIIAMTFGLAVSAGAQGPPGSTVWTDSMSAKAGALPAPADTIHLKPLTPVAPLKDPTTALVLGLVMPGMGNVYAGSTAKGLTLFALTWGSVVFARYAVGSCYAGGTSGAVTCPDAGGMIFGEAAAAASWAYGWATAPRDARDANADAGYRVTLVPRRGGVALALRATW